MTQDGVPVECPDTKCDFTYKVAKTPTITNVELTPGDGDSYTIALTGTNLCGYVIMAVLKFFDSLDENLYDYNNQF